MPVDEEEGALEHEPLVLSESALRRNWHLLSLLFSLNHACATTPQIFATSLLHSEVAYSGNAILFIITCVCAMFFSLPLLRVFGLRGAMVFGMVLLCLYVGGFALAVSVEGRMSATVFMLASMLGGWGSATLWTTNGAYMSRSVDKITEATGSARQAVSAQHASTFASYFLATEVLLKLGSSFGFQRAVPSYAIFAMCFTCGLLAAIGVRLFVLVMQGPQAAQSKERASKFMAALALWNEPRLWCLSPMNFTFGFAAAYMNGYVNAHFTKQQLGNAYVGYFSTLTVLVAAVVANISGFFASKTHGKTPFVLFGSLCFAAMPALSLLRDLDRAGTRLALLYVLQGGGRAIYESTNKALFADFFPGSLSEGAFANLMMQASISTTFCFFISPLCSQTVLALQVFLPACLIFPCYLGARRFGPLSADTA